MKVLQSIKSVFSTITQLSASLYHFINRDNLRVRECSTAKKQLTIA